VVERIRFRDEWPGMSPRTRRLLERARSLGIACALRDDVSDSSAAAKKVRLDALRRIDPARGKVLRVEVPSGLRPGYIIRLPATDQPTIDGEAVEQD
jgi:hypothetical protein